MEWNQMYNISLLGCQLDFILRQLAVRDKNDFTLIAKRIISQVDEQDKAGNKDEE